jgi:hypothetical protein
MTAAARAVALSVNCFIDNLQSRKKKHDLQIMCDSRTAGILGSITTLEQAFMKDCEVFH